MQERIIYRYNQIGTIVALIIELGLTWIADGMVGLNIPNPPSIFAAVMERFVLYSKNI